MIRTRLGLCACGLALGLAVGGAVAPQKARSQFSPAEPSAEQEAPGKEEKPQAPHKVAATSPKATDVVVTQRDPGQIRARCSLEVRALVTGYLEAVPVKEGQAVKKDDVLFQVSPVLYKAKLEAERAKVKLCQIKLDNTKALSDKKIISQQEVTLAAAELEHAKAVAKIAETDLHFTTFRAPFDGLIGRLGTQQGSLVEQKDVLTTLHDNSVMWVYFHVPEARYLEYTDHQGKGKDRSRLELVDSRIELELADGRTFAHDAGNTVTIESTFNNETGTIAFRADFPNPDRLLRHGQTGTVLIRRTLKNVIVVPQRATFEVLDRRYAYVIGQDNVVHEREIVVEHEVDNVFVIKSGLDVTDKIVLEGGRLLRDGDKVEYEFRKPEEVIGKPKSERKK